jgi:hypothetical protein
MKLWKLIAKLFQIFLVFVRRIMNSESLILFPGQSPSVPFSELELLSGTAYIEFIDGLGVCIVINAGKRKAYLPDSPPNRSLVLSYMPIYIKDAVIYDADGDGWKLINPTDEELSLRNKRRKKYPSLKI